MDADYLVDRSSIVAVPTGPLRNRFSRQRRLLPLYLLCIGVLMIVLDTTIVTVALPSMAADLGFSGASLTWLLNAYMLTFGGFLLLGGRLGDLYGQRRLFVAGIVVFAAASLACGLSQTEYVMLAARAVQGLGGAVVTAVALSLITNLYPEPNERAQALATYGAVCAAGGGIGEILGGLLTKIFSWHWIFLVNVPVGIAVCALCSVALPRDPPLREARKLDITGAAVITAASTLAVYSLLQGSRAGWLSVEMLVLFSVVALLLLLFVHIETHQPHALVPLRIFRHHNFVCADFVGALWTAGAFAWFVIAALYLQRVLQFDPWEVGLSFVPGEMTTVIFSVWLSAKIAKRFGIRGPLALGLVLASIGLLLFARAPIDGEFLPDVLPGMMLLGLGGGIASTPLMLAAMNSVADDDSGLASGIINTSFLVGGSLGLAILGGLGEMRSDRLELAGASAAAALNGGYHLAFVVGACFTGLAAMLSLIAIRPDAK